MQRRRILSNFGPPPDGRVTAGLRHERGTPARGSAAVQVPACENRCIPGADDGRPAFDDGYAYVLIGKGDGTFGAPAKYQVPNGTFRIVAGDFTRDGRIDLATVNDSFTYRDDCVGFGGADSVTILPGVGGGSFGSPSSF